MPSVHAQLQTDASRCVRALPTNARTFGYKLRLLLLKGSKYAMHRLPKHSVRTTTEKSASNRKQNALFTRPVTICTFYTQADLTIFPRKQTQHLPTRCCERRLTLHHTRQRLCRKEAGKCKITSTARKTFERESRCSAWLPTHAWVKSHAGQNGLEAQRQAVASWACTTFRHKSHLLWHRNFYSSPSPSVCVLWMFSLCMELKLAPRRRGTACHLSEQPVEHAPER
jgi:hypothetical protein